MKEQKSWAIALLAALLLSGCGTVTAAETAAPAASPVPALTAPPVPEPQSGSLHETIASEGAAGIRAVGEYSYDPDQGLSLTLELSNPWDFDNYFSLGLCLNGYADYPGKLYVWTEGERPAEPVSRTAVFTLMQPTGVTRYKVLFVPTGDAMIRAAAHIEALTSVAVSYMFYYHPDAYTREFAQGLHFLPIGDGSAAPEPAGQPLYQGTGGSLYFAGYSPDSRSLLLELSSGGDRFRLRPTLEGFDCLRFSHAPGALATENEIFADAGRIPEGMLSLRVICIEQALWELGEDQPAQMSLRIRAVSPGKDAAATDTQAEIPLHTSPENPLPPLESLPVVMENQLFRLRLIRRQGNSLCLSLENLTGLDMWLKFETGQVSWGDAACYLLGESPGAVPAGGRCAMSVSAYSELIPFADGRPGGNLRGEVPLEGAMSICCKVHYSPSHEAKPNEIYEQTLSLPE